MSSQHAADEEDLRIPVKFMALEAVLPDGTVTGMKSMTIPHDAPGEVLAAMAETLRSRTEREFPKAVEYRSTGWVDSYVPLVYGSPVGES